jgi:glyoxylase-like metal-dependent hydrolase (beta-lactamase superfamily II)
MLKAAIVPVTPLHQNCAILFDDKSMEGVVIDPGGDAEIIEQAITEFGIKVKEIWLTHGHLDHAGGAEDLKAILGVEITGPHKDDTFLLESIEETTANYGMPPILKNASPDNWLNEGDTLTCGGHEFEVRHTPGHSPGHVIFICHSEKLIIMGDLLFSGSIGRPDLPGGDEEVLLQSIKDKVLPLDDDYGFLCGHGPGSTVGQERATNPYLARFKQG